MAGAAIHHAIKSTLALIRLGRLCIVLAHPLRFFCPTHNKDAPQLHSKTIKIRFGTPNAQ
jgi:hypothetical protein